MGTFLGAVIATAAVPMISGMSIVAKRCYRQEGDLSFGILSSAFAGGSIGGAFGSLIPGVGTFVGFAVGTLLSFTVSSLVGLAAHGVRGVISHKNNSGKEQVLSKNSSERGWDPYKDPRLQRNLQDSLLQENISMQNVAKVECRKKVISSSLSAKVRKSEYSSRNVIAENEEISCTKTYQ